MESAASMESSGLQDSAAGSTRTASTQCDVEGMGLARGVTHAA